MNLHHDSILSKLGHRELRSVKITNAMHFRCLEGSVWITQHGEAEDLIVEQGTCVTLVKKGVVLLQALKTEAIYTLRPRIEGKGASAACSLETAIWPCKDFAAVAVRCLRSSECHGRRLSRSDCD